MARRPHDPECATSVLDEASAAADTRRVPRRRALYAAAVCVAVIAAGSAATTRAHAAATDTSANTVRAIAGAPGYGPDPGKRLNANFVGLAATPSGRGYWVAASDGGVFTRGDAAFLGSMGGKHLTRPVVGLAALPRGDGYWLVASDGGVFTFGHARFYGSLGGRRLSASIRAIASTPTGHGYWLLGADGGVFTFGDAKFFGSGAASPHRAMFVAMAPTPFGQGYYLLGADGGVFTYGNAHFAGAAVDGHLATGITVRKNGGYQIARTDGSVVGLGGEPSVGAPADSSANRHPVIAIAARRGGGAWVARGYIPPPPPKPKPKYTDLSQDPFLKCTRAHESDTAGGYRAVSPDGLYRGAYQFLRSTWNNVARHAGRPDLVGVDPAAAAPHDQDFLALDLYHWQGAAPWGGRCAGLP